MIDGELPFPEYDPHYFVGRERLAADLLTDLLRSTDEPIYKRSIILEGPPKSGKSWLLHRVYDLATQEKVRPITILIRSSELQHSFVKFSDLLMPILVRLWETAVSQTNDLPPGECLAPQPSTAWQNEMVDVALFELMTFVARIQPVRYLLIFFDGMDEVEEYAPSQIDVLYEFESQFLVPLLRYPNTRMLATRRADGAAQWRTFTVKPMTNIQSLKPFDPQDASEQFARLSSSELSIAGRPTSDTLSFSAIEEQLPDYLWSHPGANSWLMRSAIKAGGILTQTAVRTCVELLLRSSLGDPLTIEDKKWLLGLINALPDIGGGSAKSVGEIGTWLRDQGLDTSVGVGVRNAFLQRLHNRGIGRLNGRFFTVNPEIVALVHAQGGLQP